MLGDVARRSLPRSSSHCARAPSCESGADDEAWGVVGRGAAVAGARADLRVRPRARRRCSPTRRSAPSPRPPTRAAPEPLLPVPRDRRRHRTVEGAGRRDGGTDRAAGTDRARRRRRDPTATEVTSVQPTATEPRSCASTARIAAAGTCWRTSPRRCFAAARRAGRGARAGGLAAEGQHAARAAAAPPRPHVTPDQAFAGTFHVNEGYEQLQVAYDQACAGGFRRCRPASPTAIR